LARIVVIEDDVHIRTLMVALLRRQGYDVAEAPDGEAGLELIVSHHPDLIVSDVQMPGMTGFQVLDEVRRNPELASTPVILLTALSDRVHMRHGMTAGADDYITKPFELSELSEAVYAQLNKRTQQNEAAGTALQEALRRQQKNLSTLYEHRLLEELGAGWQTGNGADDEKFEHATVLFADMASYSQLAQDLNGEELSQLVKRFYASAGDTVSLFGAFHIQFVGEGLLAIFVDSSDTESVNHGLRAGRASLALAESIYGMRHYLEAQYPGRSLPLFRVSIGLHCGPVVLTRIDDPVTGKPSQILPVGDAVSTAVLLQKQAMSMDWPVIASKTVLDGIAAPCRLGREAELQLPGRKDPLQAAELLKIVPAGELD
jgi:CheY-like chemotaxis protein